MSASVWQRAVVGYTGQVQYLSEAQLMEEGRGVTRDGARPRTAGRWFQNPRPSVWGGSQLLFHQDDEELVRAEPVMMCHWLYHVPATPARHARRLSVRIDRTWSYKGAFTTCRERLRALPAAAWGARSVPTGKGEETWQTSSGLWSPAQSATTRDGPAPTPVGQTGVNPRPGTA